MLFTVQPYGLVGEDRSWILTFRKFVLNLINFMHDHCVVTVLLVKFIYPFTLEMVSKFKMP